MLNKIIFILEASHSAYRKMLKDDIIQMSRRLKGGFAEVNIVDYEEKDFKPSDRQQCLFITDTSKVLGDLLEQGYYAIALLHEYNRLEDFRRALYMVEDVGEMEYDSFLKAYQRLAGLPWHIADTKRLIIRETMVADVEAFYEIYREPSITCYMEGLLADIEEEREYIRTYIKTVYGFYGYGVWTLLLQNTGEVIGRAGLSWREGSSIPELGFVVAKKHQRQGYALEACRRILDFAADELEFEEIQALIEKENTASVSLCHRLGFCRVGEVRDKDREYGYYIKTLKNDKEYSKINS